MNNVMEWSVEFDVLYNNITSNKAPGLTEYEKSVFLTKAQLEYVIGLYNGKIVGSSFEQTEELRRYLDALVKTEQLTTPATTNDPSSVNFTIPSDVAYIIWEKAILAEKGTCWDGKEVDVFPVRHDEFNRTKRNPFRGSISGRVLRLDVGNNIIELVSNHKIDKYIIRYLAKPKPIILEDLTDGLSIDGETTAQTCLLNSMLHQDILNRAVTLAKGIFYQQ